MKDGLVGRWKISLIGTPLENWLWKTNTTKCFNHTKQHISSFAGSREKKGIASMTKFSWNAWKMCRQKSSALTREPSHQMHTAAFWVAGFIMFTPVALVCALGIFWASIASTMPHHIFHRASFKCVSTAQLVDNNFTLEIFMKHCQRHNGPRNWVRTLE